MPLPLTGASLHTALAVFSIPRAGEPTSRLPAATMPCAAFQGLMGPNGSADQCSYVQLGPRSY